MRMYEVQTKVQTKVTQGGVNAVLQFLLSVSVSVLNSLPWALGQRLRVAYVFPSGFATCSRCGMGQQNRR